MVGCCLTFLTCFSLRAYMLGYRMYAVQTGSMQPAIHAGDVVLVQPVRSPQLGDIVSYRDRTNATLVVTHRVTSVHNSTVITQGDAMPMSDKAIGSNQVIGRAVLVLPNLGLWIGRIRSPLGIAVTCGLPAIVILWQEYRRMALGQGRVTYTLRYK